MTLVQDAKNLNDRSFDAVINGERRVRHRMAPPLLFVRRAYRRIGLNQFERMFDAVLYVFCRDRVSCRDPAEVVEILASRGCVQSSRFLARMAADKCAGFGHYLFA